MKKYHTLFLVLGFLVIAVGAFFGGMKYQENKQPNFQSQFGNNETTGMMRSGNGTTRTGNNQMMSGARNNSGFRPVNGEIISADDKSITVKLTDGSSRIIFFSDKTTINKATQAISSDLKTGEKVMVVGQQNADGSVTAQTISLNPVMRNSSTQQSTPAVPNEK